MVELPERRRAARVNVPWHLSARVLESREVRILDLSTAGVRIEHVEPLRPGASCTFDLPPTLGSLQLTARVVWSLVRGGEQTLDGERSLRYQSGLAFIGLTQEQQAVLARVMEMLTAAGAAKDSNSPS